MLVTAASFGVAAATATASASSAVEPVGTNCDLILHVDAVFSDSVDRLLLPSRTLVILQRMFTAQYGAPFGNWSWDGRRCMAAAVTMVPYRDNGNGGAWTGVSSEHLINMRRPISYRTDHLA